MDDERGGVGSGDGTQPKPVATTLDATKPNHGATEREESSGSGTTGLDPLGQAQELMALPQIAARLAMEGELGARAPALVSLKRWSAAGALNSAQRFPDGRNRPLYVYQAVKAICQAKLPLRFDDLPPEGSTPSPVTEAKVDLTPVLERMAALEGAYRQQQLQTQQALADIAQQLARLAAATDTLEHTRRTLMTRYDAEITALRSRIEQMQAAARDNPGIDIAAARLMQAAARMESTLEGMQPRQS